MGGDQIIPQLAAGLNDKEGTGKQISNYRKELILNKFGSHLAPTNGARELAEKLQSEGLHLIVATSASQEELDLLLKAGHIEDLIEDFTTSSDAEASKPQPNIIEAALNKADLAPDRALMLGDTPYDIESAGKAGVGVIAFRSGGFSDEQLSNALAIYDDPADLLRHYDESPLAQPA